MSIHSLDLVHASLVAAPLSLDAFVHTPSLVALSRGHAGLTRETAPLWERVERSLSPRMHGVSLASLVLARDRAWFCNPAAAAFDQSIPLADYLVYVARQWVHHDGAGPVLVAPETLEETPFEVLARWRWMSLVLPADVLVAAACAAHREEREPLADQPILASRMLLRLLRDDSLLPSTGVAETHVHGNAALSFGDLWSNWLSALGDDVRFRLSEDRDLPLGSWNRFRSMSLCAAIVREALSRFVSMPDWQREPGFESWFHGHSPSAMRVRVVDVAAVSDGMLVAAWRAAFASLATGVATDDDGYIDAWGRIWRALRTGSPGPSPRSRASVETRFTTRALRYLRYRPTDALFARLFWQYLRLRVALFRTITLEPGTPGLDWFSRTDRRVALFRHQQFYAERVEQGISNASAGVTLRAFEPRFVPDTNETDARRTLVGLLRGALRAREGSRSRFEWSQWEFGVVFHFAKTDRSVHRARDDSDSPALLADPTHSDNLAYAEWIDENTRRAEALCALFERYPESLLLVRGVDVAGRELSMPTWPATSMIRAVRAASCSAAHEARRRWPALELDELRCTFHTGEDYRHLTEGLRRVHEVIEACLIRRGDRLGHAIALGDPPERWMREQRAAITTRVDRLHDLLWELDRYADGSLRPPSGRVQRAEEEARSHICVLFAGVERDAVDLRAHRNARRWLLSPYVQRQLGYSIIRENVEPQPPSVSLREWELLRFCVQDRRFFERSFEPVTVPFDQAEFEMVRDAQRWLRRIVTEREITVEANPSSNLLVADYGAIDEHPVFRLLPLQSRRNETPVFVSLNSDDPIVFATRLGDEYAYIFNALRKANVSAPEAIEWLDRVRENAIRSRFTLAASSSDEALEWLLTRLTEGETERTQQLEFQWATAERPWGGR